MEAQPGVRLRRPRANWAGTAPCHHRMRTGPRTANTKGAVGARQAAIRRQGHSTVTVPTLCVSADAVTRRGDAVAPRGRAQVIGGQPPRRPSARPGGRRARSRRHNIRATHPGAVRGLRAAQRHAGAEDATAAVKGVEPAHPSARMRSGWVSPSRVGSGAGPCAAQRCTQQPTRLQPQVSHTSTRDASFTCAPHLWHAPQGRGMPGSPRAPAHASGARAAAVRSPLAPLVSAMPPGVRR
jgi:hypothetical protein